MLHPRDVLLKAQAGVPVGAGRHGPHALRVLTVCDHYCGVESRIQKSLTLQAELIEEFGSCVFDVTLDCEDGAPVGGEVDHAHMVRDIMAATPRNQRLAVRVHAVDDACFASDVQIIVSAVGDRLSHIMLPKVDSVADVDQACACIDAAGGADVPLQVLIESSLAVRNVFQIAAHPRVESLSFGVMDFVSSHGGAIPVEAMQGLGQFSHPLVVRAKLEIAAAAHAFGKVPSHCVFTEFNDIPAFVQAAQRAKNEFGFTRMWSIHPHQIRPILRIFSPSQIEIEEAAAILVAAGDAGWGPISYKGRLHDRASYRCFWQLIERAHVTGQSLPASMASYFLESKGNLT